MPCGHPAGMSECHVAVVRSTLLPLGVCWAGLWFRGITTVKFIWIRFYYISASPEFFSGKDIAPFPVIHQPLQWSAECLLVYCNIPEETTLSALVVC